MVRHGSAESSFALGTLGAHVRFMFMVNEVVAETIRRTYQESGEFAAAIELRQHFPGITDNENARRCARMIAGWTPLPPSPVKERRKGSRRARS